MYYVSTFSYEQSIVSLFYKSHNLLVMASKNSGNRQESLNIDTKCKLGDSSTAPFKMCYSLTNTVSEVSLFACSSFSVFLVNTVWGLMIHRNPNYP